MQQIKRVSQLKRQRYAFQQTEFIQTLMVQFLLFQLKLGQTDVRHNSSLTRDFFHVQYSFIHSLNPNKTSYLSVISNEITKCKLEQTRNSFKWSILMNTEHHLWWIYGIKKIECITFVYCDRKKTAHLLPSNNREL